MTARKPNPTPSPCCSGRPRSQVAYSPATKEARTMVLVERIERAQAPAALPDRQIIARPTLWESVC